MPTFHVSFSYVDQNNATTAKRFMGDFADYATASTAAGALLSALSNATTAHIFKMILSEESLIPGVAGPSNVFERVMATVDLNTLGKKASLQLPAPSPAFMVQNNLDTAHATWTAVEDQLKSGNWSISDGEHLTDTVAGKRVFVRSGQSNMPY